MRLSKGGTRFLAKIFYLRPESARAGFDRSSQKMCPFKLVQIIQNEINYLFRIYWENIVRDILRRTIIDLRVRILNFNHLLVKLFAFN